MGFQDFQVMNSSLSPEQVGILWAIQIESCEDSYISDLFKNKINWKTFNNIAIDHGLVPLIFHRIKTLKMDIIPSQMMEDLRGIFISNAKRNLILSNKMIKCLNLLENHGISTISHKGLVLAIETFDDLFMRQISDLDLIVDRKDIFKLKKILNDSGFPSIKTNSDKIMLIYDKHCIFFRDGTFYEIHWDFTYWHQAITLDMDRLWRNCRYIKINGHQVRVLPLEDELLILCIHGTLHRWEALKWLVDIIHLIRLHKELNWQDLLEYSKMIGVSRICMTTLQLAINLGGLDLPEWIRKEIMKDPISIKIASEMSYNIFRKETSPDFFSDFIYMTRLRERLTDRILFGFRFLFYSLTIPTESDYELIDLPVLISGLYVIIHPLRVFYITIPRRLAKRVRMKNRSNDTNYA